MSLQVSSKLRLTWRSGNFDSELHVARASADRNADLYIDVNVWFHRINPGSFVTDTAGVQHPVLPWGSDAGWQDWVSRCKGIIERRLSGRFWLVPNQDWGVRIPSGWGHYRPNIKLCLRIHPVGSRSRYHLHLDCYRVSQSFCPRTPADSPTANIYRSYMAGSNGRIVNVDAWTCLTHDTEMHYQEVAVHEFGHFLGLPHAGGNTPQCLASSNSNAEPCYGVTVHQRGDLMGYGSRVERWHAFPWTRRLRRHVKRNVQWKITMQRPAPQAVRGELSRTGEVLNWL